MTSSTVARRSGRVSASSSVVRPSARRRASTRGLGWKYAASDSFPGAVTRITRSIPDAAHSLTTASSTGVSTSGRSSFGTVRLNGRNRVPSPPAGITAVRTGLTASPRGTR